ncbi:MAG: hypothetical protein QOG84_891 [Sphingomonadales bacterium]|nr:hypothetical protein [Sphingomonadales bacterium]
MPVSGPYRTPVFAAVRRLDPRTIEETRKSEGRIVTVRTYTLLPGGRALAMATADSATGQTFHVIARRKP